ncbi:CRISPR-associated endonuclease Cas3'' [Candidatus Allofournierella excrementigallinarum]|uniref:CRISPR-associated endonuclease Cas3'' n=1 Tax=Candidatus Allofournierella excrementigallinarum TaxID=2838592 RepID=UPI00374E8621
MNSMDETCKLAHISEDGLRQQTVLEHLNGTASLAAGFAEPFGAAGQAYLAGMLHDIGKYSDAFQKRLAGGQKTDHSTAGAKEAFSMRQLEVAFAVAGHHSGLPDGGAQSDAEGATLLARIKKTSIPDYSEWRQEVNLPDATERKCFQDGFSTAFYTRMLYSCLVDADYLDTETFMNGGPAARGGAQPPEELFARLQEYVAPWWDAKNELNRKRCEILRTCIEKGETEQPGLFTLTVPTGGGKTVSSLAFSLSHAVAHGKRRIVYVIPYTSIIDQTAEVFTNVLGEENVLEHHSGSDAVMEESQSDPNTYRKVLATENWDAPVIVTTAVQFFESLFSNRSSRCRKLHNLADSVIVFDEAQTIPLAYLRPCVASIGQLVRYYGASAVLCTATQPALEPLFRELAPGLTLREICTDTAGLYHFFHRTDLRNEGELTEEQLAEKLNRAQQVLCVVNRRATARRLHSNLPADGSYCLTTLLCAADRKRLLREIRTRLQNGLPCRVVSTSLIEAGVDVDFPAAWREEAGLDSVLQTAGRCNREGKYPAADSVVSVFRLSGQPVPQIIRQNAGAARSVWRSFEDVSQPQAIEAYFSLLYAVKGEDALDQKQILKGFNETMEGRALPFATAAERFHLIESGAVTVYIPTEENRELLTALRQGNGGRSLYRKLGQYSVTVYPEHLAALHAAGAVEAAAGEVWILTDDTLYSHETGLSLDVEAGKAWMI